jgi:hypothetical protein
VLSLLFVISPSIVGAIAIPVDSPITNFSSSVDLNSNAVKFDLNFKSAPDFFTIDSFGRQADSFQLFVNSDNLPVELSSFYRASAGEVLRDDLTIVRGDEIKESSQIRAREVVANYDPSTDPSSGGWGPILGSEPFVLDDTQLTFILPLSSLKDADGLFYYYLETYSFGGISGATLFGVSDFEYDVASPVPIPPAFILFGSGLAGLIGLARRKACKGHCQSKNPMLSSRFALLSSWLQPRRQLG